MRQIGVLRVHCWRKLYHADCLPVLGSLLVSPREEVHALLLRVYIAMSYIPRHSSGV
jgi:hypothetical protein